MHVSDTFAVHKLTTLSVENQALPILEDIRE
jgi:hypothetical protein